MKTKQEQRTDDRVDVLLPVQLWGMESEWEPFTERGWPRQPERGPAEREKARSMGE